MIFLSAGHSTVDPGASSTTQIVDGKPVVRHEADIAEEIRNLVAFYLMLWKVPHTADGVGDENMSLPDTIKIVGTNRPAVEFHCNAGPPAATGVETLQGPKNTGLGIKLCAAIAETLGIRNRGAKPEDSGQHHRLGFVQAGGIIVELFFITNPHDLAVYDAKKWLLAKAIAKVLTEQ